MKDKNKPWVLGIASSHNGAVCLLRGDEIVVAIQEERLLRQKRAQHPQWKPSLALKYCLDTAGIKPEDLSAIAGNSTGSARMPKEDISLNHFLRPHDNKIPVFRVGHHLAHAVGAFATSGFKESAVLIIDGSGSPIADLDEKELGNLKQTNLGGAKGMEGIAVAEVASLYFINEKHLVSLEKHSAPKFMEPKQGMPFYSSLGTFYEVVGSQVFGSSLDGAGKVMGLAPYGKPTTPFKEFFEIINGEFHFKTGVPSRYTHGDRWPLRQDEYKDLSASFQAALEEGVLHLVHHIRELSNSNKLCYAGGVALNSVANERIVREGGFDEVFIMPAAEDSGTAVGAAYYALWQITGRNTGRKLVHDAVGRHYASSEIETALSGFPAIRVCQPEDLLDDTVDLLCQGKVVGWFQGGSELGPRALGQRSILCDARSDQMKDHVNATIKFREGFRPFAPVILRDKIGGWFETYKEGDESPYMLRVMRFHEDKAKRVPAVAHVDGTGRVQTITREANGRLFKLLQKFYDRTGVPILLNTSFNTAGEPIVETPEDALCCLLFSGMDACVLEDYMVRKQPGFCSPLDLYVSLSVERVSVDYKVKAGSTNGSGRWQPKPFEFFQSFHLDNSDEFERRVLAYRNSEKGSAFPVDILSIVTMTRFGPVMHVTTASALDILKQCDGKQNGWQIMAALNSAGSAQYDEASFRSLMAKLKRASIVRLHSTPVES
jgi:carbamoyltransferase